MLIIYTKKDCPNCIIVKQRCMLAGISFTEALLDSAEKIEKFKENYPKARSVPFVISESGDVIGGFSAFKTWLHSRES